MAEYTEVKKGQSGAEAETEEIDLRKLTALLVTPAKDDGVKVTEHFEQHRPEDAEYAEDEAQEFMQHIADCCLADGCIVSLAWPEEEQE
jgi:hypothetical protein